MAIGKFFDRIKDKAKVRVTLDKNILIFGPTRAGKTSYLQILPEAAGKYNTEINTKYILHNTNPAYDSLSAAMLDNLTESGFVHTQIATDKLQTYSFELTDQGMVMDSTIRFRALDGPGGGLFKDQAKGTFHSDLLDNLAASNGFILMLNPLDDATTFAVFKNLRAMLNQARQRATDNRFDPNRSSARPELVVVFTQIDRYFYNHGRSAEQKSRTCDPLDVAQNCIDQGSLTLLKQYFNPVLFGVASIYGFIPSGEPNFVMDNGAEYLRIYDPNLPKVQILNLWQPFRIMEPLLYFLTGNPGNLREFR